jgi:hypothetical protein
MAQVGRYGDNTGEPLQEQLSLKTLTSTVVKIGQGTAIVIKRIFSFFKPDQLTTNQIKQCARCFFGKWLVKLFITPQFRRIDSGETYSFSTLENDSISVNYITNNLVPEVGPDFSAGCKKNKNIEKAVVALAVFCGEAPTTL